MLVIGHRGASVAAAENTVQAFVLADAMGADGVELDVRLAPDGRLLVKHDPLPADLDDLEGYPELREVLAVCGEMLVNVEIKNSAGELDRDAVEAVVELTIAEMRSHGLAERWIISSFDWDTIERCRAIAPDIATAYLVMEATAGVIAQTASAGHIAVHPDEQSVTAETVAACHDAGLAINTWTCNDPVRLVELADWGVDAVCTDKPDIALAVLGRRISPVEARWETPA